MIPRRVDTAPHGVETPNQGTLFYWLLIPEASGAQKRGDHSFITLPVAGALSYNLQHDLGHVSWFGSTGKYYRAGPTMKQIFVRSAFLRSFDNMIHN